MGVVACLGWGSLIWDPRELAIKRQWYEDGPFMKIEFVRQSSDGRITLVVSNLESTTLVRTLWAAMDSQDLAAAREALRQRENTRANRPEHIGSWKVGDNPPPAIPDIADWAKAHGVSGAVWTALPPKFADEDRAPSEAEVVEYLKGLTGATRGNAERYIRLAPRQIDTTYRRKIEAELGWTALDEWPNA